MTRVLVVSKTLMNSGVCVGGILETGQLVRLLKSNGSNQDHSTIFEIGRFYDIEYRERIDKKAPHVEDILIEKNYPCESLSAHALEPYLIDTLHVKIWHGPATTLFDGKLQWGPSRKAYINTSNIPNHSVGFWRPHLCLRYHKNEQTQKEWYSYKEDEQWYNITYVGLQPPVAYIPAGTLLRVSLARWWQKDQETEYRCYLQLSGWYGL